MEYMGFQLQVPQTAERISTSLLNTQSVSNFFSNRFNTSYDILCTSPYILLKNQNLNRSHRDCTNCNMVKGISFVPAHTKWSILIG